jgi:hypothetical protein
LNTRAFDLGDVLTVTTGRLLSSRHMDGVYDILDFLTGDTLWTHQLPRATEFCAPRVLAQHPDLASIDVPEIEGQEEVDAWLRGAREQYGATRTLTPLDGWASQNPVEELCDMVGPERVYVVAAEAQEEES